MSKEKEILNLFGGTLREAFESAAINYESLQEIYIQANQPVRLLMKAKEFYLNKEGSIFETIGNQPYLATQLEINTILEYASNYSLYAYNQEIRQGFLTVRGGHRIGLAGEAVVENGQVVNLRNISALTIRVAHAVEGCAKDLLPGLVHHNQIYNTLIISPPGFGKTTLLRDCIRQISEGTTFLEGKRVAVADERSEIAACYRGVPQLNLGMRTVVLDACPKEQGLMMLIRSTSPQVIAADEIGEMGEVKSILYAMHCGCHILCTIHGESLEELRKKPSVKVLMEQLAFERYLLIKMDQGKREYTIFDEGGSQL